MTIPTSTTRFAPTGNSEPSERDKKDKESALEKLSLERLTLDQREPEKPAPENTPPAPKPEPDRKKVAKKKPKRSPQAGALGVAVLPGPPEQKAPPAEERPKAPRVERRQKQATPEQKPRGNRLLLSVPRLGLKDITVGDSPEQTYLDREGIMHLSGTGFPYQPGSNTYIVGHAGDFSTSRVPNVFRDLKDLQRGDLITLRDATGRTYEYRVYDRFTVSPYDVWVTDPIPGKNVVSLQTCYPEPTFEKRLIVRGELVRR